MAAPADKRSPCLPTASTASKLRSLPLLANPSLQLSKLYCLETCTLLHKNGVFWVRARLLSAGRVLANCLPLGTVQ